VVDAQGELFTRPELCERYGISRMTAHKWLRRFRQDGVGLWRIDVGRRCIAPSGPKAGRDQQPIFKPDPKSFPNEKRPIS
jgi:hypothetical protein